MFENAINSKKQGDIGMCYAIAYFSKIGYTVSIPITDSQDYDLIVDNGSKLLKVQVKTTSYKTTHNIFQVQLKTSGGNRSGSTIKTFDKNDSDLLFILTDNSEMYLIPRENIQSKSAINLGKDYVKYCIYL